MGSNVAGYGAFGSRGGDSGSSIGAVNRGGSGLSTRVDRNSRGISELMGPTRDIHRDETISTGSNPEPQFTPSVPIYPG